MIDILFLLLIVIVIITLSGYFYTNFTKHEEDNKSEFNKVENEIIVEKETRASNLAYIVQQVNEKNLAMDTAHMSAIKNVDSNLEDITARYNSFEAGFGSIIQATAKETGEKVQLTNNSVPVDIQLMKHVSVLGGITIKDLQDDKRLKACGIGADSARCIEFPNDDGDTYLTTLTDGRSIVAGAPMKTQKIDVKGGIKFHSEDDTKYMEISDNADGALINTTKKLHISAESVELPPSITLKNTGTPSTIKLEADGSLNIASTTINLTGNVKINGKDVELKSTAV